MNDSLNVMESVVAQVGKGFPDVIRPKGRLKIETFGPMGELLSTIQLDNTITTAGHNDLADRILPAPTTAKPSQMAIGTGTPTGTALGAEISRVAFSSITRLANVVTIVANWATGVGTGTITEAGIFNAATAGDMWTSSSFAAVTKGPNDTLQITWTLTT